MTDRPNKLLAIMGLWNRSEYVMAGIVVSYILSAFLITHAYNRLDALSFLLYASLVGPIILSVVTPYFALRIFWIMVCKRPERLTMEIIRDFRTTIFHPDRLRHGIPLTLLFLVYFGTFSGMKKMIPIIEPYHWDVTFAQWDALLHGGIDPWRILQPILGYPLITAAINFCYNIWQYILIFVFFWQAFSQHLPRLRLQYLMTFFLTWIVIGTVLATIFSSTGPCFFERITGGAVPNPYAEQMAYLHEADKTVPIWALQTQEMLWTAYERDKLVIGSGISAMPSMHVSIAFLMLLLGWHTSRLYRRLFTAYFCIILVGSVHLAWHYAIDGYFSIILTYGLWRFSGWTVNKLEKNTV